MSFLKVKDIYKTFDVRAMSALHGISFEVDKSEVISIIGPSGTGKSTLLNIICGELGADKGSVSLENKAIEKNDISYLKASDGLDSDLSVIENITEGLSSFNLSKEEKIDAARDMIEVFGLEYKDDKRLNEISAGQLQRVRLAKAFIKKPKLVILDEPFTNLDEFLKKEILNELFEHIRDNEMTGILVTHHLEEAFSLSDKIMILAHGKVLQYDSPETLYQRPNDVFCARFTGEINLIASNVVTTTDQDVVVKGPYGEYRIVGQAHGKKFLYHAIRAENVSICQEGEVKGRIKSKVFLGDQYLYKINTGEKNPILIKSRHQLEIGAQVSFSLKNNSLLLPI